MRQLGHWLQNQRKKGKHKDEPLARTVQVNVTCEIETTSCPAPSSQPVPQANMSPIVSKVTVSSHPRPAPTGGRATNTPPSIDNRVILTATKNKNKDPQHVNNANINKSTGSHVGNGDTSTANNSVSSPQVTINQEHIAKITLQQQELLKKQTQQLIQLKLQQEAKKQFQLAQNKQKQQQQQVPVKLANGQTNKVAETANQNGNVSQSIVGAALNQANLKLNQKLPLKNNNVKITVKTTPNPAVAAQPAKPEPPPPAISQSQPGTRRTNNVNMKVQQINEANRQPTPTQQQQTAASRAQRGKKPEDSSQQSPRTSNNSTPTPPSQANAPNAKGQPNQNSTSQKGSSSGQAYGPNNPGLGNPGKPFSQQNGLIGPNTPVRGQVRQPPQGQANGDVRTPTPEERSRPKPLDDSPPSDQVSILTLDFLLNILV